MMALVKFVHLLAVLSFAILQVSFVTLPANALAVERDHIGRDHVHAGIIKRQGGSSKRCKPRKGSDKPSTLHNGSTTYEHTSHTTTTSTTTTSPHQTPTSAPSGGSKRILLWSNAVEPSLKNFISEGSDVYIAHWAMKPYSDGELGSSYDLFTKSNYLPQLWGHQVDYDYSATLRDGNPRYPVIASMNEPNQAGQSNLAPEEAARLWGVYLEPLAQFSKILSPAVTADGFDWMKSFMTACGGKCSVHAMDIHAYEIDAGQVIKYANQFHDEFKKDVWFGEIACHSYSGGGPCYAPQFEKFYNTVVGFFDSTPWIGAFGWFGGVSILASTNYSANAHLAFFPGDLPNGVDATNKMMQCDDINNPQTCYPNDLGKRYLSGN
ncbi:glycosyl hydrolase catalytic core-domain-containing protein [Russula brevipes]|nr:glycosyl hydrolase catalytic core-domain-containing protein [Russula brevipes]